MLIEDNENQAYNETVKRLTKNYHNLGSLPDFNKKSASYLPWLLCLRTEKVIDLSSFDLKATTKEAKQIAIEEVCKRFGEASKKHIFKQAVKHFNHSEGPFQNRTMYGQTDQKVCEGHIVHFAIIECDIYGFPMDRLRKEYIDGLVPGFWQLFVRKRCSRLKLEIDQVVKTDQAAKTDKNGTDNKDVQPAGQATDNNVTQSVDNNVTQSVDKTIVILNKEPS